MECDCGAEMEFVRLISGEMIYKCPACGRRVSTPYLEPHPCNDIENYKCEAQNG